MTTAAKWAAAPTAAALFVLIISSQGVAAKETPQLWSSNPAKRTVLVRKADALRDRGADTSAAKTYLKAAKYADDEHDRADLLVRRADCLYRAGKSYAAYEAYSGALSAHSAHVPLEHVLARLRDLAERFAEGAASLFGFDNPSTAITIYELILAKAPASDRAPADALRLAQLQTEVGENDIAIVTYRDLLTRYPRRTEVAAARLELGQLLLEASEDGDGDGRLVRQARRELNIFLGEYPEHPRKNEADLLLAVADERQAESLYLLGEFYLRPAHKRPSAARRYLHDAVRDYPGTSAAELARSLLAVIEGGEDGNPGTARDRVVSPDSVRTSGATESLEKREKVEKWLLPLEDLDAETGDETDE